MYRGYIARLLLFLWSLETRSRRGLESGQRPGWGWRHYLRRTWFHASYTIADDGRIRATGGRGEFTSICKNSHREAIILAYYPRKAATSSLRHTWNRDGLRWDGWEEERGGRKRGRGGDRCSLYNFTSRRVKRYTYLVGRRLHDDVEITPPSNFSNTWPRNFCAKALATLGQSWSSKLPGVYYATN